MKTQRHKHIPQRSCIICREKQAKRQLTRIVYTPNGQLLVDLTSKQNGRGAYVCTRPECRHQLVHSKLLDQALKITISNEDKDRLSAQLPSR